MDMSNTSELCPLMNDQRWQLFDAIVDSKIIVWAPINQFTQLK